MSGGEVSVTAVVPANKPVSNWWQCCRTIHTQQTIRSDEQNLFVLAVLYGHKANFHSELLRAVSYDPLSLWPFPIALSSSSHFHIIILRRVIKLWLPLFTSVCTWLKFSEWWYIFFQNHKWWVSPSMYKLSTTFTWIGYIGGKSRNTEHSQSCFFITSQSTQTIDLQLTWVFCQSLRLLLSDIAIINLVLYLDNTLKDP